MEVTALLLSRLQFAFTISFHIIFPSFSIGLAAWLTVLEALYLATGRPAYRQVFEFWLKIFGVMFGIGVVTGIVMAFEFGTNWEVLSRMVGPIQGVLLSYETFTAFFLEASFFGILLFGRSRVPPWFYLFSTAMVSLGTTLSAFWIMANNSWMQAPMGYVVENGAFVPTDWAKSSSVRCCGCGFRICCSRPSSPAPFASPRPVHGICSARNSPPRHSIMLRMGLFSPPYWCRSKCFSDISMAITSTITNRSSSPRSRRAGMTNSRRARC